MRKGLIAHRVMNSVGLVVASIVSMHYLLNQSYAWFAVWFSGLITHLFMDVYEEKFFEFTDNLHAKIEKIKESK